MAVQLPAQNIAHLRRSLQGKDQFLWDLGQKFQTNKSDVAWLEAARQKFQGQLADLSAPTRKDEDWRFLDLTPLKATDFIVAPAVAPSQAVVGEFLPETSKSHLVFVNGIYSPELSDVSGLPQGIYVGDVTGLPQELLIQDYWSQQPTNDVFQLLNAAGTTNMAIVWAKGNAVVESPIQLKFITQADAAPVLVQPRVLVVAETNAQLSLVEEYIGQGTYFTNSVAEVFIADNARVNHTRLQQESATSYHIGKTAVTQGRDSHYTLNEVNLGALLLRHNPEIWQQGIQTETNLNGLTVATDQQTSDTHSVIALTQPHGIANQLHKCILGDRAHTVFNGKVFVPKEAQMTDATQLNRNLMLSSKARVDTKPELQITADNVKCAHGATVSQLEADAIFYLRSRGLSAADANQLLIDAFAAEMIERLPLKSLRSRVADVIEQKVKP